MSWLWNVALLGVLVAGAVVLVQARAAGTSAAPDDGAGGDDRSGWAAALGFFGIGGLPVHVAQAIVLAGAGGVGLVVNAAAAARLGDRYPAWFGLDALAIGLVAGLVAARLAAWRAHR
jgi:hypothetical protein